MKILIEVLLISLVCVFANQSMAQPLKIDAAVTQWASWDMFQETTVSSHSFGYGYGSGGNGLETKISYTIPTLGFSPLVHVHYHIPAFGTATVSEVNTLVMNTNGLLIDIGIEKIFTLGYSHVSAAVGIGYGWEHYKIEDPDFASTSINNYSVRYLSGVTFYFPFFKGLDVYIAYKLVLKEHRFINKNEEYANFKLEAKTVDQLMSLGVSFSLYTGNKNDLP